MYEPAPAESRSLQTWPLGTRSANNYEWQRSISWLQRTPIRALRKHHRHQA